DSYLVLNKFPDAITVRIITPVLWHLQTIKPITTAKKYHFYDKSSYSHAAAGSLQRCRTTSIYN
ncbi:MAG TPA: hypothetical protein VN441_17480, partial [Syntrophomonas sp.]|nr:hypothetical protein [Syntrophomonas sp.]